MYSAVERIDSYEESRLQKPSSWYVAHGQTNITPIVHLSKDYHPVKKYSILYTSYNGTHDTTRHKKKNKKELLEALKKKNEEFFARTGKSIGEAGRDAATIVRWSDAITVLSVHATRLWPNMLLRPVVFETSDRLIMLYHTEPSKHTRCCFGHSCQEPEPEGPM